jgi:hypothetical protein
MSQDMRPVDVMEFRRVETDIERATVRRLRAQMYGTRYSMDATAWDADPGRDLAGHVFLARLSRVPVATVRFLPLTSGLSELESLGILPPEISADDPTITEGGRLAAAVRKGRGPRFGLLMQVWAAAWALGHTPLRRWVAWSRRDLLPIHRRVGADVLAGPLAVPRLGAGEFFVVGGPLAEVVQRGVRMGCESTVRAARACLDGRVRVPMKEIDRLVQERAGIRRAS